jgi:hypothetical protein
VWVPETIWTFWRRGKNKLYSLSKIELQFLSLKVRRIVIMQNGLSWLLYRIVTDTD